MKVQAVFVRALFKTRCVDALRGVWQDTRRSTCRSAHRSAWRTHRSVWEGHRGTWQGVYRCVRRALSTCGLILLLIPPATGQPLITADLPPPSHPPNSTLSAVSSPPDSLPHSSPQTIPSRPVLTAPRSSSVAPFSMAAPAFTLAPAAVPVPPPSPGILDLFAGDRLRFEPDQTIDGLVIVHNLTPAGTPASAGDFVTLDVPRGQGTFDGQLLVSQPMEKRGAGTLRITGAGLDATAWGPSPASVNPLTVAEGSLWLDDPKDGATHGYWSGTIRTLPDTTLLGTGWVNDAYVAGRLQPGTPDAVGTLRVGRHIDLAPSAQTRIRIDAQGRADQLHSEGTIALGGSLLVAPTPTPASAFTSTATPASTPTATPGSIATSAPGAWSVRDTWAIVQADQGLSGRFTSVQSTVPYLDPVLTATPDLVATGLGNGPLAAGSAGAPGTSTGGTGPMRTLLLGFRYNARGLNTADASWRTALLDDSRFLRESALAHADGGRAWVQAWGANTARTSNAGAGAGGAVLASGAGGTGSTGVAGAAGAAGAGAGTGTGAGAGAGASSGADGTELGAQALPGDVRDTTGLQLGASHRGRGGWAVSAFAGIQNTRQNSAPSDRLMAGVYRLLDESVHFGVGVSVALTKPRSKERRIDEGMRIGEGMRADEDRHLDEDRRIDQKGHIDEEMRADRERRDDQEEHADQAGRADGGRLIDEDGPIDSHWRFSVGLAQSRHRASVRRWAAPAEAPLRSRPRAVLTQLWGEARAPGIRLGVWPPSDRLVDGPHDDGPHDLRDRGVRRHRDPGRGDWGLVPYARVSWLHLRRPAVAESAGGHGAAGTSLAAVNLRPQTDQRVMTQLGVQLLHRLPSRHGDAVVAIDLGVRTLWGGRRLHSPQAYQGDPGVVFDATGQPLARQSLRLDVGVQAPVSRRARLGFAYTGQHGRHQHQHGAWLDLRVSF